MSLRTAILTLIIIAVATSTLRAEEPVPAHETLRVESQVLAETRVVNVWLPPGYSAENEPGFPVLYMPDGGTAEDFPHVVAAVDSLIRDGRIPAMLVVGIENTQRRRDMTGPTDVAEDRKIAPVVGGSAAFRAFISNELKPLVSKRFAVNGESAIIGESAAALFIVETFFLQPDLFDVFIALDPSLWWNNEQWTREAAGRLKRMGKVDVRLLLASADEKGNRQVTLNLVMAMCKQPKPGVQWAHVARPDLGHDTIYRGMEKDMLARAFSSEFEPSDDCDHATRP